MRDASKPAQTLAQTLLGYRVVIRTVAFVVFVVINIFVLLPYQQLYSTFGEMIAVPVSQALAAQFAPEQMRGRYLAFFGLAWTILSAIGPWADGSILDSYNPNCLRYASAVSCGIAVVGFVALHRWVGPHLAPRSEAQPSATLLAGV